MIVLTNEIINLLYWTGEDIYIIDYLSVPSP